MYRLCVFSVLIILLCGCAPAARQAPIVSEDIAGVVARYQAQIPGDMQKEHIPGLAVAVVDDQGVLWEEGFGYTDWDRRTSVTPATIFSLQSSSKSFTATAAMFAAQDGLVNLDEPITTYLPGFTVHSIFEEHPERKMTLRILLSHTAGFPHDPLYGNNAGRPPADRGIVSGLFNTAVVPRSEFTFEKYIASIPDTWLMYPVGARYSYSNIGIDLAGYILQVRSGMPFIQYVQQKVLDPLGMQDSTLDYRHVRATPTRAIGHSVDGVLLRPPVDIPIIPSGGVWASAEDMAIYVQFHINKGASDGKRLLREDLAETMYTPPNRPALGAEQGNGYALGVFESIRNGARILYHGGAGFGFKAEMAWYPELKLGAVVLANAMVTDGYAFNLCLKVLDDILAGDIPLYRQRYLSAVQIPPAYPLDTKGAVLTDAALRDLIERKDMAQPTDAAAQKRRSRTAGTYVLPELGFPADTFVITFADGSLAYLHQGGESKVPPGGALTEVQPGLLVTESGNTFDLRGPVLLVDNIRVVKTNPQALPFKITLYALCALLFLTALFAWPAGAVFRRIRREHEKHGTAQAAGDARKGGPWPVFIRVLAGLAALSSLFCLAIIAIMPNLVHLPWPQPWEDLTWWQAAIFRLPFAGLLLGVGTGVMAGVALRKAVRWYYLAVGVAVVVCNGMILI